MTLKSNLPNPAKFLQSQRHLGYSYQSAMADLLDNSVDAHAEKIQIKVNSTNKSVNGITSIEIIDNGIGMTEEIRDQALRLGSLTEKDLGKDLGCYGMGLTSAGHSMAKRITVLTRSEKDNNVNFIEQDLDVIIEKNEFLVESRPATPEETKYFDSFLSDTGTIVRLSKIDALGVGVTAFIEHISVSLAETFYWFLKEGSLIIEINGKGMPPHNYIRDIGKGEMKLEETLNINGQHVTCRTFELRDQGEGYARRSGLSPRKSGFYVYRNNRLISAADTLKLKGLTHHHQQAYACGEIFFSASLDREMDVDFLKSKVRLSQSLQNQIEHKIMSSIRQINNNTKKRQAANKANQCDTSQVEEEIKNKLNLIETPPTQKEKREPGNTNGTRNPTGQSISRKSGQNKQRGQVGNIKFEWVNWNACGPIWDSRLDDDHRAIVIQLNVDHIFVKDHLMQHQTTEGFKAVLKLLFCFANEELSFSEDSNEQSIIKKIRTDVSSNMSSLL